MTIQLIGQLLGFVSTALFLLSFQFKQNKQLFALQLGSFAFYVLHYFLIGAIAGCVAMAINTARCVVMYFFNDKKWAAWKGWLWIFLALYLANAVYTWEGFISLLPLCGSVACMFAYWSRNLRKIRVINLILGSPTWLVYDIVLGSISASIMESLTILSILISIIRYGWKALDMKD